MRITLALLLLVAAPAHARPKIGLALGGGGARGAAHIGVLRAILLGYARASTGDDRFYMTVGKTF